MLGLVKTLRINNRGLYAADRTPCADAAQVVSERLTPILDRRCGSSNLPVVSMNSLIDGSENSGLNEIFDSKFLQNQNLDRSVFFLNFSKYLVLRLARNGVIETIPNKGIIYPQGENDFDAQGRKVISSSECLVNCLVPNAFIASDEQRYSIREAVREILSGRYGSELVIKPECGAYGSGLMMLSFQDGALIIKVINPDLQPESLQAGRNIVRYCRQEGFKDISADRGTKVFKMDLGAKDSASEKLERLISIALTETANSRFVTQHKNTTHVNCGLIEPKLDLVTNSTGQALEARYFCTLDAKGSFERSQGFYYGTDGQCCPYFSFMKGGKSADFVNCGELLGADDETLRPLIETLGLQGSSQDYQDYIYNLLEAQARHMHAQALQAGVIREGERMGFVFDLAWRKNDFMTIPKANGHGTIKVPRPVQIEALLELPLTNELNNKAQEPRRIDFGSIYNRDPRFSEDIINQSKLFHRLIAQGGPIDLSRNLAVLHPFEVQCFNADGWQKLTEITPIGLNHDYYVYTQMLPDEITKFVPNNQVTKTFVEDFIDGKYPDQIVIKPDQSCLGDGQIRLDRQAGKILIKIVDLSKDDTRAAGRSMYAIMVAERDDVEELDNANDGTRSFSVSLKDRDKATEAITDIINASLTRIYDRYEHRSIFGAVEIGVPDYAEGHIKQIADSGHAEVQENLLKIDGHVVEGRYFLSPFTGRGLELSEGLRRVGDYDHESSPSFMKVGQGPIVVNRGEGGKAWPNMHDQLIKSNGLNLEKDEFNNYMRKLVLAEANHIYTRLREQRISINPISIDVAWDASERIEVPTSSGGTMLVPRPILMEWNFLE